MDQGGVKLLDSRSPMTDEGYSIFYYIFKKKMIPCAGIQCNAVFCYKKGGGGEDIPPPYGGEGKGYAFLRAKVLFGWDVAKIQESYRGDSTRKSYFNMLCVDDLGDNGVKG